MPLSWRLGQLEFHIENRLAEVVDAEVRIESPDPEVFGGVSACEPLQADVLLHTSRLPGVRGRLVLDVEDPLQVWPFPQPGPASGGGLATRRWR